MIPIVVLSAFLLAFLVLSRRHRKRAKAGKNTTPSHDDTQPYLQPKGELEAEEKRRYELHAQDVRYEMNGQDEIHEVEEHGAIEGSALPSSPGS